MSSMNPKVDEFIDRAGKWRDEFRALRGIALGCGLNEELKWRQPCYTLDGKNVLILGGFKEYCGLMFFKGALLADPKNVLIRPGEHTQAARQMRFTSVQEIIGSKPLITKYIREAIEVERAGLQVELKSTSEYEVPDELQQVFDENTKFRSAFEALTPGRQRAYILHFSQAKQSKTRRARIEKHRQRILDGKGLQD